MPELLPSLNPSESGSDAVTRIQPLLELLASLDTQVKAEMDELSDVDAAEMQQIRDETYRELYIDTPAKELLWSSEKQLLAEFRTAKLPENIAQIEIVEAYAIIQSEEGLRVLSMMGGAAGLDGVGKVEAFAKFWAYTNRGVVPKAREAARKLEWADIPRFYYRDLFTTIARAGDEESMGLAYDKTLEELETFTEYEDQIDSNRALIRLAALGYIPALDKAKDTSLGLDKEPPGGGLRGIHYYMSHRIKKDIAMLVWIDNEIKSGNITPVRPAGYKLSEEESGTLEEQWRELVNQRVEEVVQYIKEEPHLPRELGIFGLQIDTMTYSLEDSSFTHRNPESIQYYVDNQVEEYTRVLCENGASALPQLLQQAKDTHQHSWTKYYEDQKPPAHNKKSDPRGIMLSFWNHDKRDRLDKERYKSKPVYIESVHQLNLLCLARAVKQAAIANTSPTESY